MNTRHVDKTPVHEGDLHLGSGSFYKEWKEHIDNQPTTASQGQMPLGRGGLTTICDQGVIAVVG